MKANFPDLIVEQMKTLTRVQNNAGCQIDPLVPSIQTVGTKTKGFIYADNNQPNTAWTIKSDYVGDTTEIVINDASVFERIDMKAILGKLQNLYDKGITDKTFQTSYGTLVIYERIIGTIKFFIFELNLNTINSGLNTLSLNKIEEVTGLNICDYTFEVNSSYNADVNINVQYQNNTMRINSKNTKPEGNAFIIRGFSRLIYTN